MRLLFLVPTGDDPEAAGAVAWAGAMGIEARAVRLDGATAPPDVAPDEIPWCHAGAGVPVLPAAWAERLGAWLQGGGRILLSVLAVPLASALGAPGAPPTVVPPRPWRHDDDPLWPAAFRDWPDYPHVRGMQGWGPHPLFDGLGRGTYTWSATEGEPVARCTFRRPAWPAGRVLAVERAYVALDADDAVAWTHDVGAGHLLCLGANIAFTAADRRLTPQRDRLLLNALALLDRGQPWRTIPGAAWPAPASRASDVPTGHPAVREAPAAPPPAHPATDRSALEVAAPEPSPVEPSTLEPPVLAPLSAPGAAPLSAPGVTPLSARDVAPLAMTGAARADAPFTMGGRRALVIGDEREGVREVWLHPMCVLSEGLRLTVDGDGVTPLEVCVTPYAVVRTLADARGRRWREVVAVSPASALVRLDLTPLDDAAGAVATVSASLRVRLQWPMPGSALWPLSARHRRAGTRAVVCVGSAQAALEVRLAADGVGALQVHGRADVVQVAVSSTPGAGVRLAIVGDAEGAAALAPAWREVGHESMDEMLRRLDRHVADRAAATVQLATPERTLDVAWEWAKARLDAFLVTAPGVGTGMMAGYAASRPGWGDARPGYAWFFGRDACWCGDALLAAGLFDEARQALEFLAAHADVTGKIAHEVTTSGVAHYDAADATPLWLRFVARYAEWTGDLATVRALHAAIVQGVDYVRSTDLDADGLPDNTGVGHGWIESGPLGGGALTSYTAAIWIDALRRLVPLAQRLGDRPLADRLRAERVRAEEAFERRLRDPVTGRVYLQRRLVHPRAGAPASTVADVADDDLTALAAVPILLGIDQDPSADAVVQRLADEDFAAPWGVRLLSRQDARYRPRGYHVGAVWPLYTGWASLASFARARPEPGWHHLRTVADAAFHRERGAFDEVLDGDTGAAAGICPDQAWSAAMVIAPFVDGLLGMRPAAAEGRCALAPQWPAAWPEARVRGLRVGRSRFSLAMRRDGGTLHYTMQLEEGPPLLVQLAGAGDAPGPLVPGAAVTVTRAAGGGGDVRR